MKLESMNYAVVRLRCKLTHRLHLPWGSFTQILGFPRLLVFEFGACTEGQADGRDAQRHYSVSSEIMNGFIGETFQRTGIKYFT